MFYCVSKGNLILRYLPAKDSMFNNTNDIGRTCSVMIASVGLFSHGIKRINLFRTVKCLLVSVTFVYKSNHLCAFV